VSPATQLSLAFFDALRGHDAEAALALFHPAASFEVVPASLRGTAALEGRRFVDAWLRAFPDLSIQLRAVVDGPGVAVARIAAEGTQAASFLGIVNQEKHVDLEQAWVIAAEGGKIARARAYWCQNQLYRRLAVRRLDRVSILG
jgi:ketosteroid isomerase-like protein